MILELFKKYKSVIAYLFFGVCTTIINVLLYKLCYDILGWSNILSTIIAWIGAVVVAYITSKLYVFENETNTFSALLEEIFLFFACRILTGILDVVIMYFAVDVFDMNSTLWKLISNIIVVIANYIASKLFIFKKR